MDFGTKNDLQMDSFKNGTSVSYENVPWSHCLPAVEQLIPKHGQIQQGTQTVEQASQLAGLILLAVPLLLPCRARLVGKHSSMLADKRNTLLRCSTEKRETRKISVTRAGSVLRAVEQYQNKQDQDVPNYDKFKRFSGSFKRDSLHSSGGGSPYQTQSAEEPQALTEPSEPSVSTDDYEIIEMRSGEAPQPKECLRTEDEFEVISGSEMRVNANMGGNGEQRNKKMTKTKRKPGEILREFLTRLCREQKLTSVQITLEILHSMHSSIAKNPLQERFYRIYTKGRDFDAYVWRNQICRDFLKQVGWKICGSFIVLSKSEPVQEPLKCIQEAQSGVEELLQSQPLSNKTRTSKVSGIAKERNGGLSGKVIHSKDGKGGKFSSQRNSATNNLENITGKEDGCKEEYVDLDDSLGQEDSNSSYEDTLESSEGYIGDESYLIVDFSKMEDSVYGKDGRRRRRRRYDENEECSSEDAAKTERVPLRQRLNEQNVGLNSDKNQTNIKDISQRPERGASEEIYDSRGRKRRSNRDEKSNDPPADSSSSRGSVYQRHTRDEARETTTTSSNAADKSRGRVDKLKNKNETDSSGKNYLAPVTAAMTEDDVAHDSSKGPILSRLEELRRESSGDSSGSDSGKKKKKLVLKRGSMRRKKQLENDGNDAAVKDCAPEVKSTVAHVEDVKENNKPVDVEENNLVNRCKQSPLDTRNGKSVESVDKKTGIGEAKVLREDKHDSEDKLNVNISIKSRIANLMANMNNVDDKSKGKEVESDITFNNVSANNRAEASKGDVRNTQIEKNVDGVNDDKAPKHEKKRKLVLKVKRKKNRNVNGSTTETIETSPAESRDLTHVESAGQAIISNTDNKEEIVKQNGGIELAEGASGISKGEDSVDERTKNGPVLQNDLPQGHFDDDSQKETVHERESEKNEHELANGVNEEKCEESKLNEQLNEVVNKTKKKKFVLKRKKKVES